ncbi:SIS domain-containing protein [Marinibaculum pumilum]|uniref:Glutamine--fructose-6-phosphate aminotransferase [isomerizing] n=1 Tax=Marinibaculum pumilum TaxID=1766165 RepID=A0ABV7KUV7_9PROT
MTARAYDDQIAAIPATVADMLAATGAAEGDFGLDPERPLVFTGIGTSLHAARVAADWVCRLSGGRRRAFAADAHDVGTGAWPLAAGDQLVAISHRGTKIFPTAAQKAARAAGAARIVAVVGQAAPAQAADLVIRTCRDETARTFSVSYLASLAALARIAAAYVPESSAPFSAALDGLPDQLAKALEMPLDRDLVRGLGRSRTILITGFADDLPTAQEAALKIKEGAWLWTEAMPPEFALHGTPAGYVPEMSAIVMLPAADDGGRSRELCRVLSALGLAPVVSCGDAEAGADIAFPVPGHPLLRPFLAILPFHRLTSALAAELGTDPDSLHGGREPWAQVMTGLKL